MVDMLRKVYKDKQIPEDKVDKIVLQKMGEILDDGVLEGFMGGVTTDAPDDLMLEALRKNVWQFSAAKNHADLLRLNNLLVDDQGNLRDWRSFEAEAKKVIGNSSRYLKTEYDTAFGAAQSARMWQDIQRTKHIFPFVQLIVTIDSQTSDICQPLHNVILSVDDPMLLVYFPPNHWNCRTWVKKLRTGRPTQNVKWPEIPEAFRINNGVEGKIFSEDNAYIANTPQSVLDLGSKFFERFKKFEELLKDKNYLDVEINDEGGLKASHIGHNFSKDENDAQDILFKNGHEIIFSDERAITPGRKIDGFLDKVSMDISTIRGTGNHTIKRALNHARKKSAKTAILYFPDAKIFSFNRLEYSINDYKKYTDYTFEEIIYIVNDEIHIYKKAN